MKDLIFSVGVFVGIGAVMWLLSAKPNDSELARIKACENRAPQVSLETDQGKRIYYSFMVQCLPDVYPPKSHMREWLEDN